MSGFAAPASPGLPLAEVFGPTLQGEGPAAGRPATFVRFGACNLSCSWCDTPYTWDATRFDLRDQIHRRPVDQVVTRCANGPELVVITGGEPLLHQGTASWGEFLAKLKDGRHTIHLETNGTIAPEGATVAMVDLAIVSPKLPHAEAGKRTGRDPIDGDVLRTWAHLARAGRAVVKFVVRDRGDCSEAFHLAMRHGFPRSSVWLMPEGTSTEALQARWQHVAGYAAAMGVNATHRLHVLAWNDERGH